MKTEWECQCGEVGGVAESDHARGYRAICMCADCQAYAHFLKSADRVLDANGGTDIFPMQPACLRITRGQKLVSSVRLTPTGMFRWFARCCNTPIANSMAAPEVPFIGMVHTVLEKKNSKDKLTDIFGPVRVRMQAKSGIAPLPKDAVRTVNAGFLLRVLKFIALTKWFKLGSPSPFFDQNGEPIATPYILTTEEREALRAKCGPNGS